MRLKWLAIYRFPLVTCKSFQSVELRWFSNREKFQITTMNGFIQVFGGALNQKTGNFEEAYAFSGNVLQMFGNKLINLLRINVKQTHIR